MVALMSALEIDLKPTACDSSVDILPKLVLSLVRVMCLLTESKSLSHFACPSNLCVL